MAYVNFVNHCYVDTEVEMKEIYTSPHIWNLFENFLVDMSTVSRSPIKRSNMNHLFFFFNEAVYTSGFTKTLFKSLICSHNLA